MERKLYLQQQIRLEQQRHDQLKEWANRANVDIVMGAEGSDPGSVLYDAISSAKNKNADILLCDTAGRLHNKKNLMEELKKLDRIIEKEYNGCRRENFIVLDATTGQNALAQARQFKECTDITGVILTKNGRFSQRWYCHSNPVRTWNTC